MNFCRRGGDAFAGVCGLHKIAGPRRGNPRGSIHAARSPTTFAFLFRYERAKDMFKHIWRLLVALCLFSLAVEAEAQPQPVAVAIDAAKTHAPITKYVYGQFIEHLGGIINSGIWAEMLDDRKFYYRVVSQAPAPAPTPGRRWQPRRWTPVGPDESVTMDAIHPFVGDHSPMVKLDESQSRGIKQTGLSVRKGREYSGRAVLACDAAANLKVSLVWGSDATGRQTISIKSPGAAYEEFPLSFTAADDSEDAQLEITATGSGGLHIGALSLMPGDNVQGFRREVIAALKQLHSGVYRFPGGNFVSNHEWRDAIGPRDKRAPTFDHAWNAVQPNDVGIDEFMILCGLLDVEPYITVNSGFGDAHSAADLVEYANAAPDTPMGKLRAANGHPQPYGIKWWGIGNEMYGDWQFGVIPLAQYEIKHNLFAKAMRRVDPSIKLIASGAMPDEMTVTLQNKRITGKVLTEYGSPGDWTGGLIAKCLDNLDVISEHCYCTNNQRFDLDRGAYVNTDDPLVEWARRPANRVRAKFEHYQEYLNRYPAFKEHPAPIDLDEWSYARGMQPNTYRPVPSYAWVFHEMFRHSDVFQMAAFTFATSCVSADRNEAVLNPVGLVFKLYRDHFGTLPVEVSGNSPQPPPKYPVGGDQPKINAGSDTFPLDVAAALSGDRKTLAVAVVNPTDAEQRLDLSIKGVELAGKGRLWRMAPANIDAAIIIGQKPQVEIEEQPLDAEPSSVAVAPISVNIYEFTVK
jgi:alpha-L-arabinofuranosidase